MCGIFGFLSKKEKPFNKRAFCTMGVRNDSRGGDSCGIFIDGEVEYGVDKQKTFISFFRDSVLLDLTTTCKVALGHCRKASVGNVSLETAQPVVIYNEKGEAEFVVIHNGTIYNYEALAKKYIPEVDITGLTDSQVMARIFYYKGYDVLDEYYGGAVFVIHDYRCDKSYVFKGWSKKYSHSKEIEEERPLFYCWHNGRFCFSSIFETLYAFYYEETIFTLPHNKLMVVRGDKLKVVKEYPRANVHQTKNNVVTHSTINYGYGYGDAYAYGEQYCYKISLKDHKYFDDKGKPLHGITFVSSYGYVHPNRKKETEWIHQIAFYNGQLLRHVDAFAMIEKIQKQNNNILTPQIQNLINMLDFNPFTNDELQYYWYDDETMELMYPNGHWKWPMADYSVTLTKKGELIQTLKQSYNGWYTDYMMYDYNEEKILKAWKKICKEEV